MAIFGRSKHTAQQRMPFSRNSSFSCGCTSSIFLLLFSGPSSICWSGIVSSAVALFTVVVLVVVITGTEEDDDDDEGLRICAIISSDDDAVGADNTTVSTRVSTCVSAIPYRYIDCIRTGHCTGSFHSDYKWNCNYSGVNH